MKNLLVLFFITFVFFSCRKKELPVSVTNSPVFKFKGTVGADTLNYEAGVNGLYMYTGYYKDSQNLMTLKSFFAQQSCSICEPSLTFELKDVEVTSTNGLSGTLTDLFTNNIFNSYSLDSVLSTTTSEQFTFTPNGSPVGSTYLWDFGGGDTSTSTSPTRVFSSGGIRTIKLVSKYQGVKDSVVNTINTDPFATCRIQFTSSFDSNSNAATFIASDTTFNSTWAFGDGTSGNGFNVIHTYNNASKYTVILSSTKSGCTTAFTRHENFSFALLALANYSYTTSIVTLNELLPRVNRSAFIITWKQNGKVYKSYKNLKGINQSGNPVFTFTGLEPYTPNAAGEKTVKIRGTVDTYLYNQDPMFLNDSIKIKSTEIVLGVAYPN